MLLLEPGESGSRIPRSDRRYEHVRKVLKKRPGDRLLAGIVDGAVGSALLRELDDAGLVLEFEAEGEAPPLAPIVLVLGFPRPIQAARILRDLTSLGLSRIELTLTELGEKSYAQSDLFAKGEVRRHLVEGAEQACNPRLPAVGAHWSLERCLDALGEAETRSPGTLSPGSRLVLHPYGAPERMGSGEPLEPPVLLAVGPERGWTEAETRLFASRGFRSMSLGSRILRTETAALAASALALARLGLA
ncbi:MAG TPA: RsmE family RNA methyltransferase [Rectinemataceae bacterium]|nr:RsmE family RNA methyltransferase [Rectinemataceae bacterium]